MRLVEEGRESERSMMGRLQNQYRADSRVAAPLYSLIESAKVCGVEPRDYPVEVTLRAIGNRGRVIVARDLKSPRP